MVTYPPEKRHDLQGDPDWRRPAVCAADWPAQALFGAASTGCKGLARAYSLRAGAGAAYRRERIEFRRETGMKRTRGLARACGLAALAALAGVAAYAKPLPNANEEAPKPLPPLQKNFPLDQTFSLRDLNGKPVSAQLDVSFKLDGAFHASGYTGCNSWSGTAYPQQNQHIAGRRLRVDQEDLRQGRSGHRARLPAGPVWARRRGTW